jgi:hypothetical protein
MNKKIIIQQEQSFIAVGFSTPVTTDNPATKTVTAKFNLIADDNQQYDYPEMLLWNSDEYDSIVWTNEDVVNRINELLA